MKRGDDGRGTAIGIPQQFHHALAHLVGGLVRESDGQDGGTGDAMRLDQMSYPVRDHPRFAAAGAGKKEQRSFDVRHRGLLWRIQSCKEIHEEGALITLTRAPL
jgi:hypothetical protein